MRFDFFRKDLSLQSTFPKGLQLLYLVSRHLWNLHQGKYQVGLTEIIGSKEWWNNQDIVIHTLVLELCSGVHGLDSSSWSRRLWINSSIECKTVYLLHCSGQSPTYRCIAVYEWTGVRNHCSHVGRREAGLPGKQYSVPWLGFPSCSLLLLETNLSNWGWPIFGLYWSPHHVLQRRGKYVYPPQSPTHLSPPILAVLIKNYHRYTTHQPRIQYFSATGDWMG